MMLDPFLESARQIMQNAYVRAAAGAAGRQAADFSDNERRALFDRHVVPMEQELEMIGELLIQARLAGIDELRVGLHDSALDPELVEQAVEHATKTEL